MLQILVTIVHRQQHFCSHFMALDEMCYVGLAVVCTGAASAVSVQRFQRFDELGYPLHKCLAIVNQSLLLRRQSKRVADLKTVDSELNGMLNIVDLSFTSQAKPVTLAGLLRLLL